MIDVKTKSPLTLELKKLDILERKKQIENESNKISVCLCGNEYKVDPRCVKMIVQTTAIFSIITFSIIKLSRSPSCEETNTWLSLLTSSVGLLMPSPIF
jgi:hypothetical protein